MVDSFQKVSVLDNFYHTSFFYPMPIVLVTTVSESIITITRKKGRYKNI